MTPYEELRGRVVDAAWKCVGKGPECCRDAAPGYDLDVVSWCQIFWLKCLRDAGLTDKVWSDLAPPKGKWVGGWLEKTDDPQSGDLGYIEEPNDHGTVIDDVEGDDVYTIEGNSTGRIVRAKKRKKSEFTCFFSIRKLAEEYVPKEYR